MKVHFGQTEEVAVEIIDANGNGIPGTTLFLKDELQEAALMLFLAFFALPIWEDLAEAPCAKKATLDRDGRGMALKLWFLTEVGTNGQKETP
jgi:hypothetical protein